MYNYRSRSVDLPGFSASVRRLQGAECLRGDSFRAVMARVTVLDWEKYA